MKRWTNCYFMAPAALGIGIGAGACVKSEDADPEQRCRDFFTRQVDGLEEECECRAQAGEVPDKASCVESFSMVVNEVGDCQCPLYGKYPDAEESMNCMVAAQDDYNACMSSAQCDETRVGGCKDDFLSALMECPPPPDGLIDELNTKCGF